ncbi:RNA 2',3'-cyclic phosphodiesterase [Ornithinibacillus californiensis]|uniref:RNA 2',3'-cyclic phosphodiesterase n=1 Tax=Ornithinibacillus californiensis TaxID=161536 RepID=UPI00064DFFEC|nr:RNA 2',3'-cyclic phosphodiesterase [Ornithinibacillus californiensis]
MGKTPHFFIAIPVEENLSEEFANWQDNLKQKLSYKVWPHRKDLHITLKFLGAVEENQLTDLREALKSISHPALTLTVGTIGTFGKHDSPRVLWAGVTKTDQLEDLYKKVEIAATSVRFPKENRPYKPHITLAKKWTGSSPHTAVLPEIKENYTMREYQMNVEEFVLYQIFPSKSPKYERVETYRLKGGN